MTGLYKKEQNEEQVEDAVQLMHHQAESGWKSTLYSLYTPLQQLILATALSMQSLWYCWGLQLLASLQFLL